MIGIINYGMGNLASVSNALDYLGIQSEIFDSPAALKRYSKLVLPGVGAFGMAMKNLSALELVDGIKEAVLVKKVPLLGICLGMQLLLTESEEYGRHEGLNLLRGKVRSLKKSVKELPVPHIGWNEVQFARSSLVRNEGSLSHTFYFVHSYYCDLDEQIDVRGVTTYGVQFHSMCESGNIFGCQFHPEKSQRYGLEVFRQFHKL